MKFKRIVWIILLSSLLAIPVAAQENPLNYVTFNGFGFNYDKSLGENVNITNHAGGQPDMQVPGGPIVKNTEFILYTGDTVPADYDSQAYIQVYKTADFTGYEYASRQFTQLQSLLKDKPDLTQYMTVNADNTARNSLPYLPEFPAAQAIRARAHYVENDLVKGISYITIFRQDVSPFLSSEFFYTFQGISIDGTNYVTAIFRVNASMFPAEMASDFDYDAFSKDFVNYLNQSVTSLNAAVPSDFTPSLDTLDTIAQSFTFSS